MLLGGTSVPAKHSAIRLRCPGRLDDGHLLEASAQVESLAAEAINLDCAPPSHVRVCLEQADWA